MNVSIETHGVTYRLVATPNIIGSLVPMSRSILPDVREISVDGKHTLRVRFGPSRLLFGDETILQAECSNDILAREATKVLSRKVEEAYSERGLSSLHGAAVACGDDISLLVGANHAGKSTLAVYCCLREGLTYVGGDRTLISGKEVVGGTKTDVFRKGALDLYLPSMCDSSASDNQWAEQVLVDMTRIPMIHMKRSLGKIARIYFVQHSANPVVCKPIVDAAKRTIKLYDALDYFLDCFPSVIYAAAIPLHPSPHTIHREIRFDLAKSLATIPCYSLVGRFEEMATIVAQGGPR